LGTSTSKQQSILTDSDGTITFETGSGIGDTNNYKEYDAGINTVSVLLNLMQKIATITLRQVLY
jgi:hypothetical protein